MTTIHFETFDENSLLGLSAYLSQQYELWQEAQKARKLAAKLRPQVDQLRAIMNAVADIDCGTVSEPTVGQLTDAAYGSGLDAATEAEAEYRELDLLKSAASPV